MSKQKDLKRLPVPPLQETLQRYLDSIKPLVTPIQFDQTSKVVQEFGKPNGIGQTLYKILEAKAASTENWLADWWLHASYLEYRMPVVVYSNPAMALPRQVFTQKEDQLKHAALLIAGALDFLALVERQQLNPEMMGKHPLDMSQYQKIFSTCRVPAPNRDKLETYFLSKDPPRHVLVVHNNEFFAVEVFDSQGNPYNENQILQQLHEVVSMSAVPGCGVGVLTTEHRDVWARAFEELCQNPRNANCVELIKRAILVVCLDQKLKIREPYEVACAYQMLLGGRHGENAANRWCDKTVQLIVGEDGYTGLLYEHSPSEGPPVAMMVDHCYKYIDKKEGFPTSCKPVDTVPKKLQFEPSERTIADIKEASTSLSRLTEDLDLFIFKFKGYGKEFIKSCQLSPDSYVQMAMQLAYYKIHKEPGATYESASTRKFIHGRTETIRSTSSDSVAFCKSFESSSSGLAEKVQSLRKAVQNHKDYTNLVVLPPGLLRDPSTIGGHPASNSPCVPQQQSLRSAAVPTAACLPQGKAVPTRAWRGSVPRGHPASKRLAAIELRALAAALPTAASPTPDDSGYPDSRNVLPRPNGGHTQPTFLANLKTLHSTHIAARVVGNPTAAGYRPV
ncbi:hypothetical protein HPB48_021876 [Haemaphysalis longicornis]|uniref:Choline/carnitine acyltransferase domain-containing protein n=1 Tax=Haemaphysalis longicornis TaxID=44386 RepID=A0A9J6FEY4_HAELO|nr:hypothetical protein HPB48_021876 [Haemaphysalis longicornis]